MNLQAFLRALLAHPQGPQFLQQIIAHMRGNRWSQPPGDQAGQPPSTGQPPASPQTQGFWGNTSGANNPNEGGGMSTLLPGIRQGEPGGPIASPGVAAPGMYHIPTGLYGSPAGLGGFNQGGVFGGGFGSGFGSGFGTGSGTGQAQNTGSAVGSFRGSGL